MLSRSLNRYLVISTSLVCFLLAFATTSSGNEAGFLHNIVKTLIQEQITEPRFEVQSIDFTLDKEENAHAFTKLMAEQNIITNFELLDFNHPKKSFTLRAFIDNENYVDISGTCVITREVWVPHRNMNAGELITDLDLELVHLHRILNLAAYVVDAEELIGRKTSKQIMARKLIKRNELFNPLIVRERESIHLVYSHNNIELKTIGIALVSGRMGDNIKVRNQRTGLVVTGKIIGKNMVKVDNSDD